jgi:hypothetical protein
VVLLGEVAYRFPRDEESRRLLPARAELLSNLGNSRLPVAIPQLLSKAALSQPLGRCHVALRRLSGQPIEEIADPLAEHAAVSSLAQILDRLRMVSAISAALPTPVTTVSSSRSPSAVGQTVTFTATVGPAGPGTVTFSSQSGTLLCPAVPLSRVRHRTYRASCTTGALPPGRDKVVAAYSGDAGYGPSVGTVTQIVRRTHRRC